MAVTNDLPPGITKLIDDARTDVLELLADGRISRAAELARQTGLDLDASYFPMYFTGDFAARLVLVHLNPKLSPRLAGPRCNDFDSCLESHKRFGHHHWELDPSYRSAFDHKQVRFLRPFGVIDFLDETSPAAKRNNAAMAIDAKLQLELIPYASPTFPTHRLSPGVLRPHFERVIGAISAYPRDYVLFCGAVFDDLLEGSGYLESRHEHPFRLPTTTGTSKGEYRFSNVMISHGGQQLRAGVARSFATQGLPMAAYGRRCRELHDLTFEPRSP